MMFIQVHARCYGEHEPVNGVLWLCNLCRSGAPPPPCCLCPLIGILGLIFLLCSLLHVIVYYNGVFLGGAMKPTTDGRWAHLACAMWIPGVFV